MEALLKGSVNSWSNSLQILMIWTTFYVSLTGGGALEEDGRGLGMRSPHIEPPLQRNLTLSIGQTAFLKCPVKFLGDKTVSWMRRRDLHILTTGNHVFTSDSRVSLLRERGSWTLRLERVQRKDDSPYECQINTEPKMRLTVFLSVIGSQNDEWVAPPLEAQVDYRLRGKSGSAEVRILGKSNLRVQIGGTLELTCISSQTEAGQDLMWFRNEIPLQSANDGGLEIHTIKAEFYTISKLKLNRIDAADSGKYFCGNPTLRPQAFVVVSVVQGHEASDFDSMTVAKGTLGGGGPDDMSPLARSSSPVQHSRFHRVILPTATVLTSFLHIISSLTFLDKV